MNLVVVGPGLEARPLPDWRLKVVPGDRLTPFEALVQWIGQEMHGTPSVAVVGLPWVNPRGRARAHASLSDYLDDPVSLLRVLVVAFTSEAGSRVEAALVGGDVTVERELALAQEWVVPRLANKLPDRRVVWASIRCRLEDVWPLEPQSRRAEGQSTERMGSLRLPGVSDALKAYSDALGPLFT